MFYPCTIQNAFTHVSTLHIWFDVAHTIYHRPIIIGLHSLGWQLLRCHMTLNVTKHVIVISLSNMVHQLQPHKRSKVGVVLIYKIAFIWSLFLAFFFLKWSPQRALYLANFYILLSSNNVNHHFHISWGMLKFHVKTNIFGTHKDELGQPPCIVNEDSRVWLFSRSFQWSSVRLIKRASYTLSNIIFTSEVLYV
jgi:hypothetical protein